MHYGDLTDSTNTIRIIQSVEPDGIYNFWVQSHVQVTFETLEPTNEACAVSKISAIKLCRFYHRLHGTDFLSAMSTSLYGPHDIFDLETSQVLTSLILGFHEARESWGPYVELWGTGRPLREFLHARDLAEACLLLMERNHDRMAGELVNLGTEKDISIRDLARMIAGFAGYDGEIRWDRTKPDGIMCKVLDTSRISAMGWRPRISLRQGIEETYAWYRAHVV